MKDFVLEEKVLFTSLTPHMLQLQLLPNIQLGIVFHVKASVMLF